MLQKIANKNIALMQKIGQVSKRTTREKLLAYLSAEAQKAGRNRFEIPFNRQVPGRLPRRGPPAPCPRSWAKCATKAYVDFGKEINIFAEKAVIIIQLYNYTLWSFAGKDGAPAFRRKHRLFFMASMPFMPRQPPF